MTLGETAAGIADAARERASGQAVLVVVGPDDVIHLDQGADPLTERTRFDVGSITKTFTALLLAQMAVDGDLDLEAPAAGEMTYVQLATHTSGLPRLPANLMPKAMASHDDPYRDYTVEDLEAAIDDVTVTPGDVLYSNFGYMVLAWALARRERAAVCRLVGGPGARSVGPGRHRTRMGDSDGARPRLHRQRARPGLDSAGQRGRRHHLDDHRHAHLPARAA